MFNSKTTINIALVTAIIMTTGCTSEPDAINYQPYHSNSNVYRNIVSNNKLEWRESLYEDIGDYKSYVKKVFGSIENQKNYFKKIQNIHVQKKRQKKPEISTEINYDNNIINQEYNF